MFRTRGPRMINSDTLPISAANVVGRHLDTTTDKYQFIPTTQALSVLANAGWVPARNGFSEARTRKLENKGFQRHQIRLCRAADVDKRHRDDGGIPQILLINSHMGTAAFKLTAALFEMICANGLIVASEVFEEAKVRHVGYTDQKVQTALDKIVNQLPAVLEKRNLWRSIELDRTDVEMYAISAASLRKNNETHEIVDPVRALTYARQPEQRPNTAWNVFNRVQDAMINGGVQQRKRGSTNRRRTSALTDLTESKRVNQALWLLTENIARSKQGLPLLTAVPAESTN